MLKKVRKTSRRSAAGRFAIVAARYNARYVDSMVNAARAILENAGAGEVQLVRVPGAYEVPLAAGVLARQGRVDAIICLGVILRGETQHAQLIGEAVTDALMRLQVEQGIPCVHEVLLLENAAQAEVRCLDPHHNRGAEAANTALDMVRLLKKMTKTAGHNV